MTALDTLRRLAAATVEFDPSVIDARGFSLPGDGGFSCRADGGIVHLTVYSRGRLVRACVCLDESGQARAPADLPHLRWEPVGGGVYRPSFWSTTTPAPWRVDIPARKRDISRVRMWRDIALGDSPRDAASRYDLGVTVYHAHTVAHHLAEPGELTPEEALRRLIIGNLGVDVFRDLDQAEVLRFMYEEGAVSAEAIARAVCEYGLPFNGCWARVLDALALLAWRDE